MTPNQYLIVRLTPDQKQYTYWVVDAAPPPLPVQAQANLTTSSTTLKNAIGVEMPTLST